jgi:hypothetical protein
MWTEGDSHGSFVDVKIPKFMGVYVQRQADQLIVGLAQFREDMTDKIEVVTGNPATLATDLANDLIPVLNQVMEQVLSSQRSTLDSNKVDLLRLLTGQNLGLQRQAWQAWWDALNQQRRGLRSARKAKPVATEDEEKAPAGRRRGRQ